MHDRGGEVCTLTTGLALECRTVKGPAASLLYPYRDRMVALIMWESLDIRKAMREAVRLEGKCHERGRRRLVLTSVYLQECRWDLPILETATDFGNI